jgi:hypothetical protein
MKLSEVITTRTRATRAPGCAGDVSRGALEDDDFEQTPALASGDNWVDGVAQQKTATSRRPEGN